MSILSFIETKIGSLHNWPLDIQRYTFCIRPSNYTTITIAAFCYGNKIPLDLALELFQDYNHPSSEHIELFRNKYETWPQRTRSRHIFYYYNMSIGRTVYINRSDFDQMELVDEDPIVIKIGFGDFFPNSVRLKIENTRGE